MTQAYIYDAIRTPRGRGKSSGSLYTTRPIDLLSGVLKTLKQRHHLDTLFVDDVVIGCVTQSGEQGGSIARFASLLAGYGDYVPGVTLNRFCGSGLEAINHAAAQCASGYHDLVVAGGVESMSRVKMGSDSGAFWDAKTQWQVPFVPQGISADLLSTINDVSREELDEFALASHMKASAAQKNGNFQDSLVPVCDQNGTILLEQDENVQPDSTLEKLGSLSSSFEMIGKAFAVDSLTKARYPEVESINHFHTAGNSSAIVDGAVAVLVGSEQVGHKISLKPKAKIRSVALCGTEPVIMLNGPMPASKKALKKAGMQASDIDLFEVNEAFAVVPILFAREMGVYPEKINVHGGAIALGHPLGATGAMLLNTVIDALEQKDLNTALITLCIGGGMGIATIIERV